MPEYHRRKRGRRQALEVRLGLDPAPQFLRHLDVGRDPLAGTVDSKRAKHEPQLETPEPAPERGSIVHKVPNRFALTCGQVSRREAERALEEIFAPAVENAAVDRREQPLMRIDDERVGAVTAGHD